MVLGNAFQLIASADLAIPAATHQVQISLFAEHAGVPTAALNLSDLGVHADSLGGVKRHLIVVAQLSIHAVTPRVHGSASIQVSWVLLTTCDLNYTALASRNKQLARTHHLSGVAGDAELTISIVSKGKNFTLGVKDDSVIGTTCNLLNLRQAFNLLRHENIIGCTVTEGTLFATSPGVDFSFAGEGNGVLEAACDLFDNLAF
jgi:hypothetical protein